MDSDMDMKIPFENKTENKKHSIKGEAFGIPDRMFYLETQKLLVKNINKLKNKLIKIL